MNKRSKRPKPQSLTRHALAFNVHRLMVEKYSGSTNKPRALARDARVGLFTIQRLLKGSSGVTVKTIEAVSHVLGCQPYELLRPSSPSTEVGHRVA